MKHNLVQKAGSWYSYGTERIGQGKANAMKYMVEHPEAANELDTNLRNLLLTGEIMVDDEEVDVKEEV